MGMYDAYEFREPLDQAALDAAIQELLESEDE